MRTGTECRAPGRAASQACCSAITVEAWVPQLAPGRVGQLSPGTVAPEIPKSYRETRRHIRSPGARSIRPGADRSTVHGDSCARDTEELPRDQIGAALDRGVPASTRPGASWSTGPGASSARDAEQLPRDQIGTAFDRVARAPQLARGRVGQLSPGTVQRGMRKKYREIRSAPHSIAGGAPQLAPLRWSTVPGDSWARDPAKLPRDQRTGRKRRHFSSRGARLNPPRGG